MKIEDNKKVHALAVSILAALDLKFDFSDEDKDFLVKTFSMIYEGAGIEAERTRIQADRDGYIRGINDFEAGMKARAGSIAAAALGPKTGDNDESG